MLPYDPRLLELLSFLTRRQAWLSPREISKEFRLGGKRVHLRTVYRWVNFLRAEASFVYYPYPRANVLGLQDVLVRVWGLKDPEILGILPFASSFNVEVGLGDNVPFVGQGYWIPGDAMAAFERFWDTAKALRLVDRVELFSSRNTHFFFSPFHRLVTEDGSARLQGEVDNRHFEELARRHVRERFEVQVGKAVARSPLVIPLLMEHLWTHFSSRHVWDAIREKGEGPIRAYGKGFLSKTLDRPGAALRLLQEQWHSLLEDFDAVFLQPRIFFDWTPLKNSLFVSVKLRTRSADKMVTCAARASEHAIYTSLKPGLRDSDPCLLSCFLPSDQLLPVLAVVREFHSGDEAPFVAVQDVAATERLFQASYCRVDWRLFDPATLSWRFDSQAYLERLKDLRPAVRRP